MMNRQARTGNGEWYTYGAVTLAEAARKHAFMFGGPESNTVEVRDESNPGTTWVLTVERHVSYRVIGMRGGE